MGGWDLMSSYRSISASVVIVMALTMPASARDDVSGQGILVISKMAGACGILHSMMSFQTATKMPGGDDFVVRFWATEAARLGLSIQELSERCNQSVGAYDKLWAASGALEQGD